MTTPYTYQIAFEPFGPDFEGVHYVGSRSRKGCHPDELLKPYGYHTSSKIVKKLIKEYGLGCFRIVNVKTHEDIWHNGEVVLTAKEVARKYEEEILTSLNLARSDEFLNLHNGGRKMVCMGHSEEIRKKISVAHKGKCKPPRSEEHRRNLSAAHKGRVPWNKDIPHSEEHRANLSLAQRGRVPWNKGKTDIYSDEFCANMSLVRKGKPWAQARRNSQNNKLAT